MTGDLLHLQSLEGGRNAVLSDVVRRGLLGKNVEHVLRQPRRWVCGHVPTVVGVGAGFPALGGHTPTRVQTGQFGREIQIEEAAPEKLSPRYPREMKPLGY